MKLIPLNQAKFALVDDEDFEFLNQWKWSLCRGYAVRSKYINRIEGKKKNKTFYMHREIHKTSECSHTDHIDGNPLNNQKANLRSVDRAQNMMNRHKRAKSSSIYKGVSWSGPKNKWAAYIRVNKALKHLGYFSSELEASYKYDSAARDFYGEFCKLNHPSEVAA